jgi:hypothetical protein
MISREHRSKLTVVDLSDNTSVAAAASNTQTLTPPAGYIYIIRAIFYNAPDPAGSAAGTHYLQIRRVLVTADRTFAAITATTGNAVDINSSIFIGDSAELPTHEISQNLLMYQNLIASNSYPIKFFYHNATDVAQAGTRTLEILVEMIPEAD